MFLETEAECLLNPRNTVPGESGERLLELLPVSTADLDEKR
jgi:hypothetical protein